MAKATRKFDGKTYRWYDDYYLRQYANRTAARLRKQGKAARVVYSGGKWVIYTRG